MCRGQAGLHALLAFLLGVGLSAPRSSAHAAPAQAPPVTAGAEAQPAAPLPSQAEPPEETPPPPLPPDLEELAETPVQPESPILLLASVPNMFGDFSNPLRVWSFDGFASDLPTAGGATRPKIAENNKPLPMDRCYFMYNHFQNAFEAGQGRFDRRKSSLDRYLIGLEKTFLGGCWSADIRMPFTSNYAFDSSRLSVDGGQVGNLSVAFKRLLLASRRSTVAAGLGIETPTGSDVTGYSTTEGVSFALHNDAVHLSPFLGALVSPNDLLFYQAFVQLDVPTNGNQLVLSGTSEMSGILRDQMLLYVDVSAGCWLYRNPCACVVTGLASLVEFHYTTTLEDAGILASGDIGFGNFLNRVDVANFTVGLHAEIAGRTELRVGGVFPLRTGPEKPFDAEVQVSLNRRF